MKHPILATLLAVLLILVSAGGARAQDCTSAAQIVADLSNKIHDLATDYACQAVDTLGYLNYTSCFSGAREIDVNGQLVSFWNNKANNSWATIGPRRLDMGQAETGTLIGTTGRMFVSLPVLGTNRVTITIDETGGKGKVSARICKVNPNNQFQTVKTVHFNDTQAKKNNTSEQRKVVVNGAKNQIIVVDMDGKSVGNKLKYRIRMTKQ